MISREVDTDVNEQGHLSPQRRARIVGTTELAVAQGRIEPNEAQAFAGLLLTDYEAGVQEILARPIRSTMGISENQWLDYARATGILSAIDDPRVRRSWER